MALFALMALALARPTLHTESVLGGEEVDTAIAIVVDTSLSMEYTEKGNDRLKEAKLRAADILKKATDRSEVFVIDSAEPTRPGPASPAVALKQVEALVLRDANRPLNAAVVQAYAAVGASELPRKENLCPDRPGQVGLGHGIGRGRGGREEGESHEAQLNAYVLRLTPKEIEDVAIIGAEPASTVAIQGEPLEIKVRVRSWGPKTSRVVKLYLDQKPRGSESIELPENGEAERTMLTPSTLAPGLPPGRSPPGGWQRFHGVR